MYLPSLNRLSVKSNRTDSFGGINRGRVCDKGQFYDTKNLSSCHYPVLTTLPHRYELDSIETDSVGTPLYFLNKSIYSITPLRQDLPSVYTLMKGEERVMDFEFIQNAHRGNLVNFNSKTLLVGQDKAYEFDPMYAADTAALSVMGYELAVQPAHEVFDYKEATLRLSLLYEDMTEIGSFSSGTENANFPEEALVDDLFAKYKEYYRLVYKDSTGSDTDVWQPVVSVRLRLDIGDGYRRFKKGDYVRLKGLKYWNWAVRHFSSLERFVRIDDVDAKGRYVTEPIPVFEDMNAILEQKLYPTNDIGYGSPIIDNQGNDLYMLEGSVSACMPSMDFVCSGANRVWGCSNGAREIYASELGNARNFSVFEGLSGDSYAVTVGSDGDFTACFNYLGTPVFFKENEMIVITGSRPASFTLNSYSVRGIPKDSPQGGCVVGDVLYYISGDGVYAYDGSSCTCISEELGDDIKRLRSAILGGDGDMLYVSGDMDGSYVRFSYDIQRRIWHSVTDERVIGYIRFPDATLQVGYNEGVVSISTLDGGIPRDYELSGASFIENEWYWETGDISYTTDKKYVRRLALDMCCEGECELYISYDGEPFLQIDSIDPHARGSRRINVFPRRCDYFRIRMEGSGDMTLYALTEDVEEANENG